MSKAMGDVEVGKYLSCLYQQKQKVKYQKSKIL
jgi:hypothetical protein